MALKKPKRVKKLSLETRTVGKATYVARQARKGEILQHSVMLLGVGRSYAEAVKMADNCRRDHWNFDTNLYPGDTVHTTQWAVYKIPPKKINDLGEVAP